MIGNWFYALACVLVPVGWGLLMVSVVGGIGRLVHRRHDPKPSDSPGGISSPEYHI